MKEEEGGGRGVKEEECGGRGQVGGEKERMPQTHHS